ncbi:guanylate kinase [Marinoscillum sp. MHG1-6]|uniref:guanylate kinase n=1 Tax=Marinoscillum sp. MHG1-6 TaxID=2959627 RepID=UPI00215821F9|nr:guanylate kinase [Marinoscillum sp. MHG1-6]
MSSSGKAVIFCAPSGAGKTTIVKHLIQNLPTLSFSISATTRSPRSNEVDGKDYYFLSERDFKQNIETNDLYEWQEVYPGMFYGTLKAEVERIWAEGKHVIFDVDVIGGLNLKKVLGDRALAVFVSVESVEVLEQRLRARNTESEETLQIRVGKASEEMKTADQFDYILVNRELKEAFAEAEQVVGDFIAS